MKKNNNLQTPSSHTSSEFVATTGALIVVGGLVYIGMAGLFTTALSLDKQTALSPKVHTQLRIQ